MNYIFAAKNDNYSQTVMNAFYPVSDKALYVNAGTWPDKYVEVSDSVYNEFMNPPPEGKVIGADAEGYPIWIDAPPPSHEQQVASAESLRNVRISYATNKILPLQDAVDLAMATEAESLQLTAWRKYRVLLTRVDTSTAPDINWPQAPTA